MAMNHSEKSSLRLPPRARALASVGATALALGLGFQNCSPVNFTSDASSLVAKDGQPGVESVTAGADQRFPPLKMLFVVDNSGTMGVNQISLSQAFQKMFDGDNASNLAKFDASAFLMSTSQKSLSPNGADVARMPQMSIAELASDSAADIAATYRKPAGAGFTLNGAIPGDLVGYRLADLGGPDGLMNFAFYPAPVLSLQPSAAGLDVSPGVRKPLGGSVDAFAQAFRSRLSMLNPNYSAIDPNTNRGVLDDVVDNESGLCAVARALEKPDGLFAAGDLGAIVIVSDEDDNDPAGRNCVSSFVEHKGTDALIDGRCEEPVTKLTYLPLNPNPSGPTCAISYRTGVNYKIVKKSPTTDVNYYRKYADYSQRQTQVTYYTATHAWKKQQTTVSFWRDNSTYEIAQTKVNYTAVGQACVSRDGQQTDCHPTYAPASATIAGAYPANCAGVAARDLPANAAIGDSAHPLSCAPANRSVSGACSPSDASKVNCQPSFATSTVAKDGAPASSSDADCAAFAASALPPAALTQDPAHKVSCMAPALVAGGNDAGACPSPAGAELQCVTTFSAPLKKTRAEIVTASRSCAALALSSNSSAASGLPAAYAAYEPSCMEIASSAAEAAGDCPTSADKIDCQIVYKQEKASGLAGAPASGQACGDFAQNKLLAGAVYGDASRPMTCVAAASSDSTVTGVASYSATPPLAAEDPAPGSSCSAAVLSYLKTKNGIADAGGCTIDSYVTATNSAVAGTCAAVGATSVCDASSGAKRACSGVDTPAASQYASQTTTAPFPGDFNCQTLCSSTSFCASKSGTVGDNYKNCSAQPAPVTRSAFTGRVNGDASICASGQKMVATNGPYFATGTSVNYVAGTDSANGTAGALSNYIVRRSWQLFGEGAAPAVSVFVRQPGDPLGSGGSIGAQYNAFAAAMGGQKASVLSNADGYATALQSLSQDIKNRLNRSFALAGVRSGQIVQRVWLTRAGQPEAELPPAQWTATGGTVTISASVDFAFGDVFRFQYQ